MAENCQVFYEVIQYLFTKNISLTENNVIETLLVAVMITSQLVMITEQIWNWKTQI